MGIKRLVDWIDAILRVAKRKRKERKKDRVCLHSVVVYSDLRVPGITPREYGFNRRNFIRGYVYAPCFTHGGASP